MFDELKEVKQFKEIKRLQNLRKAESYLEPKRATTMEIFCEYIFNGLLFSQWNLHHRCSTGLYIGRKY